MVSYLAPRGRFLIKSANLRQAPINNSTSSDGNRKWPIKWAFRRNMSTAVGGDPGSKVGQILKQNQKAFRNIGTASTTQKTQQQKRFRGWFTWTGLLFRWAPMGICIFGALEWQIHNGDCKKNNLPKTASTLQANVYCSLPLRIISRCWGWLADCYVPVNLRPWVYGIYSNTFKVNIEEAANPDFKHYRSIAEFFTRPLKEGARAIAEDCHLVSPADGKVLHFGSAASSLVEQVKGITYRIDSFLGPESWISDSNEQDIYEDKIKYNKTDETSLYQCVIYLAPGDYHRFHSPTEWKPTLRRHFPGELLSVSPKVAKWLPGLFCLNERATYIGKWEHGFFSYTAVGATNVGSVQIYIDEKLRTNKWMGLKLKGFNSQKNNNTYDDLNLPTEVKFDKGELVGQFNMGSTIVLLFEAPKNFEFVIESGQKIRVGEPLGFIKN